MSDERYTPSYDHWEVVIEPKSAGYFGAVSVSWMSYDKRDAEDLQEKIIDQVRRHVDGVGYVHARYTHYQCNVCKGLIDTDDRARHYKSWHEEDSDE